MLILFVYTSHRNCVALKIIYFMEDRVDCSYMEQFSNVFTIKIGLGYFCSPAYLETSAKYKQITFQKAVQTQHSEPDRNLPKRCFSRSHAHFSTALSF